MKVIPSVMIALVAGGTWNCFTIRVRAWHCRALQHDARNAHLFCHVFENCSEGSRFRDVYAAALQGQRTTLCTYTATYTLNGSLGSEVNVILKDTFAAFVACVNKVGVS
jgi:hypothetical protein